MLKVFFFYLLTVTLCWAGGSSDIVRLCDVKDYDCIRDVLVAKSNCNPAVEGFIPGRYVVPEFPFNTPYFNASYVDRNLVAVNHDKCYVSEFFFNRRTDVIVIGIDCPNFYLQSNRTLVQHASLQEDTYYSYIIRTTYPLIRMTNNLRSHNNYDMCASHVFTDIVTLPTFHIDPNDKPTKKYLSRDPSLLNIFERENFYFRGYPIFRIFINKMICDFGCQPQLREVYID